jgi:hypothetical protein
LMSSNNATNASSGRSRGGVQWACAGA